MTPAARVLVVDDEVNILTTMGICFDALGYETRLCSDPREAVDAVRTGHFDLAFVDLKMAPLDGLEVLARIRELSPDTTVVIITAHGSIETAIEAVRKGAYDYLQKPFDYNQLQVFATKVLEHHRLEEEVRMLRRELRAARGAADIITRSSVMREQLDLAARVADSSISVLLEGESGTGKEVFAHYIHARSSRAAGPFVKVNCAALPEQLLESELFGHVRGAFTGAIGDRQGRFELAHNGTMLLDEIAEMSPPLQAKLLRVLQSGEFERVGESTTRTVDVRVIAATNRNLDEALREGTFRDDLFYRLNAVRIKLPPLRERPEDIPLLVQHFLTHYAGGEPPRIEQDTQQALRTYRWNGNVRELQHVIERAVLLARDGTIGLDALPVELRTSLERPAHAMSLEEVEKLHIIRVLQHARDLEDAARTLGIDPATLYRKRKKFGL